MLVGNYLHSHFESPKAHEKFLQAHKKDIYAYGNPAKGVKKAYRQADDMIHTLESDSNFQRIYQGDKEVIVTGTLFGVKWRGKIDCLNLHRKLFLDLKTVDDIHKKHWSDNDKQYVSFAIARGYDMQMAVYKELIKQTFGVDCEPLIIAVSKQDVPDKGIFSIPDDLMDYQLTRIQQDQPHIEAVKAGKERPIACGHCAYCRSQKQLSTVIDIDEIPLY